MSSLPLNNGSGVGTRVRGKETSSNFNTLDSSVISFPLTLTLSPRRGKTDSKPCSSAAALTSAATEFYSPSPRGEGRGEGKRRSIPSQRPRFYQRFLSPHPSPLPEEREITHATWGNLDACILHRCGKRFSLSSGRGPGCTAIELRILSVIPTRNPNPTLTLLETHTEEITIRSRIKRMKTAL